MKSASLSSEQYQFSTDVLELETASFHLVVWNDHVNTFDWVIKALMEICDHTPEQAEQCALLIHFKGKYAVKSGSYEELLPKHSAICDRGIQATIEETV